MKIKKSTGPVRRKITEIRRDNAVVMTPPGQMFCRSQPAIIGVSTHRVGKSGSIHIKQLPRGANVTVAQVNDVFVVSVRPRNEVERIASRLPGSEPSALAALSAKIRGIKHGDEEIRTRHSYTGIVKIESPEAVLAGANLRRASRVR